MPDTVYYKATQLPDGRWYMDTPNRGRVFISPVAMGEPGPTKTDGGVFRGGPVWNTKTGQYDYPIDWTKIGNIAVASGLGLGVADAAGAFAGAGSGAGTGVGTGVGTGTGAGAGAGAGAGVNAIPWWVKAVMGGGATLIPQFLPGGAFNNGGGPADGGLGPGTEEFMDEIRAGLAMQRQRMEQAQPVYDALVHQAWGNLPQRYRGAPPAGMPDSATEAPAGAYVYESPRFGRAG